MATNTRPFLRARHSGVALVVTLITLSILVALLVAFVSSMSLERQAAHSYEETQRAKLVAQGAVSHAVDLLRTNIPDPALLSETTAAAPGENWVVNPGRLTVLKQNAAVKYIPLHTGEVTAAPLAGQPRDAESVDLNSPLPGETIPAITGTAGGIGANRPPMRVRWVNVVQDPTTVPGPNNRLVSRYAFWIDDESARLNFNTALGKPEPAVGSRFGDQLTNGTVTPTFERGDSKIVYGGGANPLWALGRPQSVNLDSLFENSNQLLADKLIAHTFLQGFARYPQAILDFIDVPSPAAWFDQNRYNLTFYSRSPEFNTFGKSRFFTTYVPLSLEAGPSYQHPFIFDSNNKFDGSTSEILHLNSLFGTFGFTSDVTDEDDGSVIKGGNVVNRMQVDMLLGYLRRTWPGYTGTFVTKYNEAECWQIALNAVLMARMATTMLGDDLSNFSRDWSFRSTSVDYVPDSDVQKGATPERFYWPVEVTEGTKKVTKLMLPQMPGPHITEVRLLTKIVPASRQATTAENDLSAPPKNNATQLSTFTNPVYVQYRYEIEYYMEPSGPVVDLTEFPTRVDFMDITASGGGQTRHQQFGPTNATGEPVRASRNWAAKANLRRLTLFPAFNTPIGPAGARYKGDVVPNRRLLQTPIFTLGQREIVDTNGVETKQAVVPRVQGSDYDDWDPQPFEASDAGDVTVAFKFRPGMSIYGSRKTKGVVDPENDGQNGRPRQMVPLGTKPEESLQATFILPLTETNVEKAVSWQINDPRLSSKLAQWNKQGPDLGTNVGTPGAENRTATGDVLEPAECAAERSKFRYIQRAPVGVTLGGYELDRGDEYTTSGRVASPGYWSLLHTGMQSGVPWRTLNFGSGTAQNSPPDWLLLDLIGATYPMTHDQWKLDSTLPDAFSTPSYMNSTAGQVNLNSRIYPQTPFFQAPERPAPLTAVFKNLRSDSDIATLVENIAAYQTESEVFEYVGELANVPGYAGSGATPWEKESLLRNMAGCLTTKSNTFGVWGVAQVVKKLPKNVQHDAFERGDTVRAEKRFYALVERYVWPGRDGVPGNAHADDQGKWDRLAMQRANISMTDGLTDTLFQLPGSPPLFRKASQPRLELDANKDNVGTYPAFDGPNPVGMNPFAEAALGKIAWTKTALEDAYNPPQAAIKYRVVYFKYLDP